MNRILIYGMGSKIGGVEQYLINVYKNIDRNQLQFDFIIYDGKKVYCEETIKNLGGNVFYPNSKNLFVKMMSLSKIIKNERKNHNCIYFNTCGFYNILPFLFAKHYKYKKIIVHAHNTKNKSRSEFIHFFHYINRHIVNKIATKLLACSTLAAEWIFGKKTVKNNKVEIINNAIDIEKFIFNQNIREKIRKQLNVEDKFVIGHIGRFSYQKNHEFLVDMFKNISNENSEAVLLLIGEGNLKEKIVQKVKENNLEEKVIFLGTVKNINEIMQAMDVFVLPSYYEGLPVVGIEAQASGIDCFFSDTITTELKINDNVKFLNINNTKEWCENIMKIAHRNKQCSDKLINDYDIKNCINKITNILFYEK